MSYKLYIDHILSNFSADVGIDLGTATTPLLVKGKGIVFREPTYVARDLKTGSIIAVGSEAKAMEGRTPPHIEVIRPVRDGVIADFEVAERMLNHFLRKLKVGGLFNPRVIIGVPTDCTDVEWRAVTEAALSAGARRVYIIEQPLAGAIGAGLPVTLAKGSVLIDIGGGTSEVAVTSMGGIVNARTSRIAGDEMDEAILNYVRKKYNMLIGIRTAEDLKITIGSARKMKVPLLASVRGRDLTSGLPRTMEMDSNEIAEALQEIVQAMVDLLKQTIESTPPELVADIFEQGVFLTGGGTLLRNMDQVLTDAIGVICKYPDEPTSCVVLGADRLFRSPKLFKAVFYNREKLMQI
jgi:rod shape-determining protein MreB